MAKDIDVEVDSLTDDEFAKLKSFDDEFDKIDFVDEFPPSDDDTFDEEVDEKLRKSIIEHEGKKEFWDYEDNEEYWLKNGYEIKDTGEEGSSHEFEHLYVKKQD
jgi:hypothetical protein